MYTATDSELSAIHGNIILPGNFVDMTKNFDKMTFRGSGNTSFKVLNPAAYTVGPCTRLNASTANQGIQAVVSQN